MASGEVGAGLSRRIHDKLGANITKTCNCLEWIARLNAWGPGGCREKQNFRDIVTHLLNEAEKRDWWKLLAKIPFAPRWWIGRNLVMPAIVEAEEQITKNLSTYFDRVVVLHMEKRADRWEAFQATMATGWPFKTPEIFKAIEGDKLPLPSLWPDGGGAWGCMQGHRQILERAILDGVKSLLVLEDDAILAENFTEKITAFLCSVPGDWDQLMMGGQHRSEPHAVRPGVVRCTKTERTQAYAVRGQFMRRLYQQFHNAHEHCDHAMSRIQADFHVYAPDPFLIGQASSQSDINGRENPTKFWVPPDDNRPVLLVRCPRDAIDTLRPLGFHAGYQLNNATGYDVGISEALNPAKEACERCGYSKPDNTPVEQRLRKSIETLQWECASEQHMVCTVWHPGVSMELLRKATEWPIHEVAGNTASDVLNALPAEIRDYVKPLEYHTRAAFDVRMQQRRANPIKPWPLGVFYHVACMNNWREVFDEQADTFDRLGLAPVAGVLGSEDDAEYVAERMKVAYLSPTLTEYEVPTLELAWEWAKRNPDAAVMYAHTKGVSNPTDANKPAWRSLMTRYVIEAWEANVERLAEYDAIGVDWQQSAIHPHFSGNFWLARADWLKQLNSPTEYRAKGGPTIAGNAWERMAAEVWIGSKPFHHVESLCCTDTNLWSGSDVFRLLTA